MEQDPNATEVAVARLPTEAGAAIANGSPSSLTTVAALPAQVKGTVVTRRASAEESDPHRSKVVRRRIELSLGIAVPILLLVGWEVASQSGALNPLFFPAPSSLWSTTANLFSSGQIEGYIGVSFRRVLEGFFLGSSVGFVLGMIVGSSRIVRAALEPLVYALWTIPKLALLPLLLLFFGLGETPIILLIAIECMFLVLIPTITAFVSVPLPYSEAATSFGASRLQMLRYVTIPAAMPQVFVALRLAAGASVLVMVAAEYVDGKSGLGFFIFNSWQLFATKQMYVGIVTVAVLGAAFTLVVSGIGRYFTRWQRS